MLKLNPFRTHFKFIALFRTIISIELKSVDTMNTDSCRESPPVVSARRMSSENSLFRDLIIPVKDMLQN
jgi:hypothetical protein